jgi:hydrogenase maturation protein HypF
VTRLAVASIAGQAVEGFHILASQSGADARPALSPDLALCSECEMETFERTERRFGYAFSSCARCGPRFSVARALPFDRGATSMDAFPLCSACKAEYEGPHDRRFHAQTICCPACGPRLSLGDADGSPIEAPDPLAETGRRLCAGEIVAIKGIGGFHLACDATSREAVARLRERKRREARPFAVMVRDLAAAQKLGRLEAREAALLASPERPIVLVRRIDGSGLAEGVAPDTPLLGLLLPYAPLHALLLERAGRPLVMTSGNRASEPIARRDAEAVTRLAGLADAFLLHDRFIQTRCDDSVARVVAGAPLLLRRSRGFVPRPIRLARPVARPLLGCGAQLKNTFCLAVGDLAYLGPHVGDLEALESLDAYEEAVAHFEHLLGITPQAVAHDLHPDFASTRHALARGLPSLGVQHHHAHVASVLAERGEPGPVLALVWDGVGYGSDGGAWGGELFVANADDFERLATLRPLRLAGGDWAVKEVWRLALAALLDAFEGAPPLDDLRLFRGLDPSRVAGVRRLIETGVQTPPAHGVGRLFDAVGALALERTRSDYEGHVASIWEGAADPAPAPTYPFRIDSGRDPVELDLRAMLRAVTHDLVAGVSPALVSARFHDTLAEAGATLIEAIAEEVGRLPVVLAGGCFQNARLTEALLTRLAGRFEVWLPRAVPPGDGGIALGQIWVADARLRAGG